MIAVTYKGYWHKVHVLTLLSTEIIGLSINIYGLEILWEVYRKQKIIYGFPM